MNHPDPKYLPDNRAEKDGRKKGPPFLWIFALFTFLIVGRRKSDILIFWKKYAASTSMLCFLLTSFYCLDSEATLRDVAWHKQSYASCLFTRAKLHDQRIAVTLRKIEVRRVSISLFPLTSGTFLTMQMEIWVFILTVSKWLPNSVNLP